MAETKDETIREIDQMLFDDRNMREFISLTTGIQSSIAANFSIARHEFHSPMSRGRMEIDLGPNDYRVENADNS